MARFGGPYFFKGAAYAIVMVWEYPSDRGGICVTYDTDMLQVAVTHRSWYVIAMELQVNCRRVTGELQASCMGV